MVAENRIEVDVPMELFDPVLEIEIVVEEAVGSIAMVLVDVTAVAGAVFSLALEEYMNLRLTLRSLI
jgi:hypothetical protein